MEAKEFFTEEQTKYYITQIILAFEYIHSKGVVYRDLRPENILIDSEGYIKITDFGLSKRTTNNTTASLCGLPEYYAPEILVKGDCTKAIDFWCLGNLIYEMLTQTIPFYSPNTAELYQKIQSDPFKINEKFPASKECADFIEKLLIKNPL